MKLERYKRVVKNVPEDVRAHVEFTMNIVDRIHYLLESKFDGKQKGLADVMGKSEAEVSKWFSGIQNFTTKTLIKLEIAFGAPIIAVCTDHEKDCTFESVNVPYTGCKRSMEVTVDDKLREKIEYKSARVDLEMQPNLLNLPA